MRFAKQLHYQLRRSSIRAFFIVGILFLGLVGFVVFAFRYHGVPSSSLRGGRDFDMPIRLHRPLASAHNVTKAVIVACHAVVRVEQLDLARQEDSAWNLLDYQKNQGFPGIIASHVDTAIAAASNTSLLIFSGGQTRKHAGPISEAASYYYMVPPDQRSDRIVLEEYARDSYENVLFSICRFKEYLGYYPTDISVVGFDFKQDRFVHLIRNALRFPVNDFHYIGVKVENSQFNYANARKGEQEVYHELSQNIYSCNSASLIDKKNARNPFRRSIPYELACPELSGLLKWCGPDIYPHRLPWHDS